MSRRGCPALRRLFPRFFHRLFPIAFTPLLLAPAIAHAQLIVGVDDPTEGIWNINPSNNSVQTFLPGNAGANLATDEVNKILYFMVDSVRLWKWDYSTPGNTPVFIASLTSATSSPFISMNGLGFNSVNGKLYGARSLASGSDPEGFYEIDPTTGFATNKIATPTATYEWGGFDRDASTGKFYANGDPGVSGTSTPGIFEVNFTTNTFTQIAPYPVGATDMDGLAAGNGKIYMIEDHAVQAGGKIHVYNTITGSYEAPLQVPWFFTETFAGGTYSPTLAAALAQVPEPTTTGALALGATGLLARRRRQKIARRAAAIVAGAVAVGCISATDANAQLVMATDGLNEGMYLTDLSSVHPTNQFPLPANIATWQQIFVGRAIRGMAADEPNRMLYWLDQTVEGASVASTLWRMSYDTLAPQKMGIVRNATSGFDMGFMGLAIDTANQKMYATYNIGGTPGEGIYEIANYSTPSSSVFASPRLLYNTLPGGETAYDLSSLDYDPVTNKVYGINNDSDQLGRGLYSFDLVAGSISLIVKSPDYRRIENDFDGLATGGGKAFFTTDEEGFVYSYDFALGSFTDFLSPVLEGDLFGGAAYAPGLVPEPGTLSLLAGAGAMLGLRRRRGSARSINSCNQHGRKQMKVCTKRNVQVLTMLATTAAAGVSFARPPAFTVLIKDGENIAGVGNVTSIEHVTANNTGNWLVEVDTDGATTSDTALIRDGILLMQEGFVPAGLGAGTLSSFDTPNLTNTGIYGGNNFFSGTGNLSNDSAVMRETAITVRESTVSIAPQFSANTIYTGWFESRWNDNNQVAVLASVDDPAIATTTDRAMVRWNLNGAGALISEQVIVKEGDALPTMGGQLFVDAGGTGPHNFAFNNAGEIMYTADGDGATTADSAVFINNTMIAREGDPSVVVGGRNWGNQAAARVDINNAGGWVAVTSLDNTVTTNDNIIVANGTKVIQEGDAPPGVAGAFTLTGFGSGAVAIDDNNNVFWYGDWNDPNTAIDTGIFMNGQLLVQEGVTMINGALLTGLSGVQDNFSISDNGQYLIFEGVIQGVGDAAIMIQVPEPASASVLLCLAMLPMTRRRRR